MKWMGGVLVVVLTVLLGSGGYAWAKVQTPKGYQVYDLGQIVVTGTQDSSQGVSITSEVTAEDIEESHSLTVPQALFFAPGVSVTSGRKNEPSISIHGFEQFESLILIDGIPYYETNYGKLNLNQLPTEMISRIDIVKGAPSVLYGPNAMAGVINIITKKQGLKPSFGATVEGGEYGNYRVSASHGNSLGKFNYWINLNRRDSDGWRMSGDFEPRNGNVIRRPGGTITAVLEDGGKRNNSDFTQTSLWTKMGLDLGPKSQYYLSAFFIDSSWGFPPSTDSETVFTSRPAFSGLARMDTYQDWGLDLSAEQALSEAVTLRGKVFYHNHIDDYVSFSDTSYEQQIAVSRFKDYFMGFALFADFKLAEPFMLRTALHYRGDSHQERADEYLPFTEAFSYTGSAAAEAQWTLFKGFTLTAGASYDWFTVEKSETNVTDRDTGAYIRTDELDTPGTNDSINPMVGASWTLEDSTRLFASIARKTRFPTLQQMFSSRSGNIELKPEFTTNYTLGASRPLGEMALAHLSLFFHDIADRISRDGPGPEAIYENYASVQIYGLEVGGELRPLTGLRLNLNYTYLNARDRSEDRVTDKVIGVPEHKVDFRITYQVPRIDTRLLLQGLYMAEQYDQVSTPSQPDQETLETAGYFLANAKITQPICDNLEAYLFVNNIFDRDYESESGYPGMGRNFWLGLKASF